MPKKKPVLMRDLVGKRVVLAQFIDTDLDTGPVRARIPSGTKMSVASVGRGFNLEKKPCPRCGVSVYVTDVRRAHVKQEDDPEAPRPAPAAFWTACGEGRRCSSCGGPMPEGAWWPFCPTCGSRMGQRPGTMSREEDG